MGVVSGKFLGTELCLMEKLRKLCRMVSDMSEAMGLGEVVGWLEPGMEADLVAVRCEGASALYDQLLFQHDAPVVEATYVRGCRLSPR